MAAEHERIGRPWRAVLRAIRGLAEGDDGIASGFVRREAYHGRRREAAHQRGGEPQESQESD